MNFDNRLNMALRRCSPQIFFEEFIRREMLLSKFPLLEKYIPSDLHDVEDVAFGVTKSGFYLDASGVVDESGKKVLAGSISHGMLLAAAGLSSSPDDPKPKDDYMVRGIVKKKLDGSVLFWEDTSELVKRRRWVKIAITKLLEKALIKPTTKVFGALALSPICMADEIRTDW